jgi:hypothetical protein
MFVDEGEPALVKPCLLDRGEEAHLFDDLARGAAYVDGLATLAGRGCALDDGHVETNSGKPVAEGWTANAGA